MRSVYRLIWPALLAAQPAGAETAKSFQVSASIVSGCVVVVDAQGRWGAIDLGSVAGVEGTSVQGTLLSGAAAGLTIECTPGVSASLAADAGDHAIAGERRLMRAGGTETIAYRLYADGANTPWTGTAVPIAFVGGVRIIPIRAVATLTAPTAAGHYADTVRVTLSW